MSTLRPTMPFGGQLPRKPVIKPKESFQSVSIQVGDGRNISEEEQDEKTLRGIAKLRETYTRQQEEIGEPAAQDGYAGEVTVTRASQQKIDQKRKDAGAMPAIQPAGSTIGLKTPGLTWTVEDAVDRGDHDMNGKHTEAARVASGKPANPEFNPYGM